MPAADEAADWVKYTNAPNDGSNPRGGVDWAAVRAANGHPEPYRVKFWELGNELGCSKIDPRFYANAIKEVAMAMKAVDPTIKIGVVDDCDRNERSFYRTIQEIAGEYFDF